MNASARNLPQKLRTTSSGFTLIELMVTIAVMAIIAGIAAPSISNQLANQRVKSTAATLENALKEAKVESIIRRREVKLTYNNNNNVIEIKDDNSNDIASYKYDKNSEIKSTNIEMKFKPNKTSINKTYIICDSNSAVNSRKISITKLGVISSEVGGTC